MRCLALVSCLLCAILVLPGCPTDPPEELPDVSWEPPLTSSNGGELNFGLVEEGDAQQLAITGTNNTEVTLTFQLDVSLDGSQGWLYTAWDTIDVEPEGQVSFGPTFNPNGTTPDEASGTAAFLWEDHVVTYVIRAEVDRD